MKSQMKSNKQRRQEIKARRLKRAEKRCADVNQPAWMSPLNSVAADPKALSHNNTYGPLPAYYVDKPFICVSCGKEEVWTARRQKWWYEIAKGNINTIAVRCHACRQQEKQRRTEARRIHFAGLAERRVKDLALNHSAGPSNKAGQKNDTDSKQ